VKGIVFNLLEAVVRAEYGDDAWDDLRGNERCLLRVTFAPRAA
jgi:hypothetical protein